jgi:hypothetical protein
MQGESVRNMFKVHHGQALVFHYGYIVARVKENTVWDSFDLYGAFFVCNIFLFTQHVPPSKYSKDKEGK